MTKPVPARGRPAHKASERSRNRVALLAALGWPGRRIANAVGLDPKTLHAHYAAELDRDAAYNRISGMLMTRLLDLFLTTNSIPAARELRVHLERAGQLRGQTAPTTKPVGKKEAQRAAALEHDDTTELGRLMIRREARQRADGEPPN
jgi:hypothetical protein